MPIPTIPLEPLATQLTDHGHSYETSATVIDAISTDEPDSFMEQLYTHKQFAVTQHQPPAELICRGIRYAQSVDRPLSLGGEV